MKYSHLLFDADNTLFDFDGSSKKAFDQFIQHMGLDPKEDYYRIYQIGNHQVWNDFEQGKLTTEILRWKRFDLFFKSIGVDRDPHKANTLYLGFLVDFASLIPGARELLDNLKRNGYTLAIITNGLKEVQKPRIKKKNLTHYFNSIIVSDEIGIAKPDPLFFEITADTLMHPDKKKVLVIGDSLTSDMQGGNNYGYDTCWYNPRGKENKSTARPTYVVTQLQEILKIV